MMELKNWKIRWDRDLQRLTVQEREFLIFLTLSEPWLFGKDLFFIEGRKK